MSSTSWLSYLNTVPALDAAGEPSPTNSNSGFLSDELRSQLEAWTTVAFEDQGQPVGAGSKRSSDALGEFEGSLADPSPYAKRPFRHANQYNNNAGMSLEKGFNAFSGIDMSNDAFMQGFLGLDGIGSGVDGSNTLFPDAQQEQVVPVEAVNAPTPALSAEVIDPQLRRSTKKQRTARSSAESTPSGGSPALNASTSSSVKVARQPLLTKAAILAQQAAELEALKVLTPEEEAARQAELNRIAAEDDKRRRNTAASARFRVKKKQREATLESKIQDLNAKLEKAEKELEATKVENNFLRDLVIRKVGLADLPLRSTGSLPGSKSGGQEGPTGMGTSSLFTL